VLLVPGNLRLDARSWLIPAFALPRSNAAMAAFHRNRERMLAGSGSAARFLPTRDHCCCLRRLSHMESLFSAVPALSPSLTLSRTVCVPTPNEFVSRVPVPIKLPPSNHEDWSGSPSASSIRRLQDDVCLDVIL